MGWKNSSFFTRRSWWTCFKNWGYKEKTGNSFCTGFVKNTIFICMFKYFFPHFGCCFLCTWNITYFRYCLEKTFFKTSKFFAWNFAFYVIIISTASRNIWLWKNKKCAFSGCFYNLPSWKRTKTATYTYLLFFEWKPYIWSKSYRQTYSRITYTFFN